MRPLTAALAVLGHPGRHFELSGVPRMHERPIGDLVDALRAAGLPRSTTWASPVTRRCASGSPGTRLDRPIRVRGDVSSQFLTALLLALPLVAAARRRDRGRSAS
jgi:3-phosphoshikimate 1-carboxyvinyltransferase